VAQDLKRLSVVMGAMISFIFVAAQRTKRGMRISAGEGRGTHDLTVVVIPAAYSKVPRRCSLTSIISIRCRMVARVLATKARRDRLPVNLRSSTELKQKIAADAPEWWEILSCRVKKISIDRT
jgi:hypothetical protein